MTASAGGARRASIAIGVRMAMPSAFAFFALLAGGAEQGTGLFASEASAAVDVTGGSPLATQSLSPVSTVPLGRGTATRGN